MSNKVSVGFPIFGLLGVLFVGLKLAGVGTVSSWSWWLVLLPFYGPLAFVLGLLGVGAVLYGLLSKFGK